MHIWNTALGKWRRENPKFSHPPVHSEFKTPTQRKIMGDNMALNPVGLRTSELQGEVGEGATFPKLV